MRTRPVLVMLLSSLALFACGGTKEEAQSAANPWADFKGTYSTPASPEHKAEKAEAAKKDTKAKDEATEEAQAAAPKKASKGTVKGESVSSISVDSLTDASKTALKAKFVSNSVVTGPQYELVQVQLKGATVQIIRPAEKPSPNGPAIASPKAKNGELSKTDAGWYDEEADVLVLVNAPKKAAAQKALGSIVKH